MDMTTSTASVRVKGLTVNDKNRDRIAALIENAEGRSTSRTLSVQDVLQVAEDAEKRLDAAGLPKRLRVGVAAYYNPWAVPHSYGHAARGTALRLQRTSARWVLTSVDRDYVPTKPRGHIPGDSLKVTLPDEIDPPDLFGVLLRNAHLRYDRVA